MTEAWTARSTAAPGVRDLSPLAVKQCCAAAYGSDIARMLLGDSFHPGGTELTERLGQILELTPQSRVLDVAAGTGASALFLAAKFGCEVVGVDYGGRNVEEAGRNAQAMGVSDRVSFQWADAERLPFSDASFDAIICECAFCTFPNKQAAAHEFARVLRVGGRAGLSDLTRNGPPTPELDSLMAWVACIADAQPLAAYVEILSAAKLKIRITEEHNGALSDFANRIRTRLLAAEVLVGLQKMSLPGLDFAAARSIANSAVEAVTSGRLGYAMLSAIKAP